MKKGGLGFKGQEENQTDENWLCNSQGLVSDKWNSHCLLYSFAIHLSFLLTPSQILLKFSLFLVLLSSSVFQLEIVASWKYSFT